MNELLSKISNLNQIEEKIFFRNIYENEKLSRLFHIFLKTSDKKSVAEYLSSLHPFFRSWLITRIKEVDNPEDNEIESACEFTERAYDELGQQKLQMEKQSQDAKEKSLSLRDELKSKIKALNDHFTDQELDIDQPLLQKPLPDNPILIDLPKVDPSIIVNNNIYKCIAERKSRRKFTLEQLSLSELSYLLWATQGLRKSFQHETFSLRTIPSGGARHPFETYIGVNNVESLAAGIYRYLPFTHQLLYTQEIHNLKTALTDGCRGQTFAGDSAVCFIWSCIPYRTEWRYSRVSGKIILQDSGHLCQNLYLAAESISCGTCAIGAYDQTLMDNLIQIDGENEFVIYVAPVGKIKKDVKT